MDKLKALLKKLGATAEDIEGVEAEIEADKEAEVDGLKRKNQELIRKSKESREGEGGKVAELEEKLQALTEERATMDKANKKTLEKLEKLQADLKVSQDLVQAKSGKLAELLIDGGLAKSLYTAGVRKPGLLDGATALLRTQAHLDEEKGEAYILVKDPQTGAEVRKPLAEYVEKDWAASETAKDYLSAPASSGGGSGAPGNSGSGGKTMQRAQFNALPPASQMAYVKERGKLTD